MGKFRLAAAAAFLAWYLTPAIDRALPDCGMIHPFGLEGRQLAISCGWAHWYTHDGAGFWSTQISLRPPQVHWSYLSDQWAMVLHDERSWHYDQESKAWMAQQEWIKKRDDLKSLTFPTY